MPTYTAPLQDLRFVLHDVLSVGDLTRLPGYEDATTDVIDAVLEEGAKLVEDVLQPLNRVGDEEGCRFENGVVRTPPGFKQAYDTMVAGGWPGVDCDPRYGGQGLPGTISFVMDELMSGANLSFAIFGGLTHGAYNAIDANADERLKDLYLPKLASGSWTGTMCLTEAQCGSDLGLIRTRAIPAEDGSYRLTGTKIFVSAGEHDLSENIVHLVLARLPDAPAGVRGISMFVVPKFVPVEAEGGVRPSCRNGVTCGAIERKMGIHGSPTCVLNLDEAKGWMVGDPNKGLAAMFVMMNAARLVVGLQGLGLAEASYQNARDYARQRLQGRALRAPDSPDLPADPIIVHPDVRRSLLTMKSLVEGGRALAYWVAKRIDIQDRHPDPLVRAEAGDAVALLIPVVKAFLTDTGFEATNLGVQVLGGHGYVSDWGMEQFVRDARITQIYEGTNGIQALDLIGRKVPEGTGRMLRRFFHPVDRSLTDWERDPDMAPIAAPLAKAFRTLQRTTAGVAQQALRDPDEAGAAASDYLRMFGLVAVGFMWVLMIDVARQEARRVAETGSGDAAFYQAKIKTGRFYLTRVLPQVAGLAGSIAAGAEPVMDMGADAF